MAITDLASRMASAGPMWVQTEEDVRSSIQAIGRKVSAGPLLCIASGGCSVLGLLRAGAERVVAIDINPAQLEVVRLKLAGLESLEPNEFLEMWISRCRERRLELYERVREKVPGLGASLDAWVSGVPDAVELADAGGMEGVGAETRSKNPDIYCQLWHWIEAGAPVSRSVLLGAARAIAVKRQSRAVRLFRPSSSPDPAVGAEMVRHFVSRFEVLLNELPTRGNPYLAHALLGTYPRSALPDYFRMSSRGALRGAKSRVSLVKSDLADAVDGMGECTLAGADISNVGEFLSRSEWDRVFVALHRTLQPGAAVVHRNFIWDEPYPVAHGFWRDETVSSLLYKRDRSFIYRAITVDRREA